MIRWPLPALVLCTGLGPALPALAVTCYEVIDRSNTVVYSGSQTPVDLSAAGAPARDAMFKRGELLVIYDTNTCVVVGRGSTAGTRKYTVEEIVAEWRSNWGASSYSTWSPGGSGPATVKSQGVY